MTLETATHLVRSSCLDVVADEDYKFLAFNLAGLVTCNFEAIADFEGSLG